jgi:hypothetical protein
LVATDTRTTNVASDPRFLEKLRIGDKRSPHRDQGRRSCPAHVPRI